MCFPPRNYFINKVVAKREHIHSKKATCLLSFFQELFCFFLFWVPISPLCFSMSQTTDTGIAVKFEAVR